MQASITFEERQLMALYNSTGTRAGLIDALTEMQEYLFHDEAELSALTKSALAKLRAMSDADYGALDLIPDFTVEELDVE